MPLQKAQAAPQHDGVFQTKNTVKGPSNLLMIRVPFFLLFSLNQETAPKKSKKGTTGVPSLGGPWSSLAAGEELGGDYRGPTGVG